MCFIAQGLAFMPHGLHGFAASATPCMANIAKNENIRVTERIVLPFLTI